MAVCVCVCVCMYFFTYFFVKVFERVLLKSVICGLAKKQFEPLCYVTLVYSMIQLLYRCNYDQVVLCEILLRVLYIRRSREEPVGTRDSSVDIVTRPRARLLRNGDHIVGKYERILYPLQLSCRLLGLHSLCVKLQPATFIPV